VSTLNVARTETIGAAVTGADADQLLSDASVPGEILEALETHSVLVFPKLGLDRETQVSLCQRLGDVDFTNGQETEVPGIMLISLDPAKSSIADYHRGTVLWHMDGVTLPPGIAPQATTILTAIVLSEKGGQTEFASTYGAYDALSEDEKDHFETLRVRHSMAAIVREVTPDPTPEQEAAFAGATVREHPLVWRHRSGRRSLVIGRTADSVVGMEQHAGRAFLNGLLERAATRENVYRHEWSVGDLVMWDNRGVVHRVEPYDAKSGREMIRTTLVGDEPIQ
jgi:alpha-ketoglutarate-dependent taurine dioxygenase